MSKHGCLKLQPTRKPLAMIIAALCGSGFVSTPAVAQIDRGGARSADVDEMVVTATRREASVQELPFNIAAFDGATLERQRVTTLNDLSRIAPGMTVIDQGPRGASLMTVRGLNVRSIDASEFLDNTGGRTVATYLGDVPVYLDFKIKDLERVEVLLGPQGTLYGEGTLGGAVRYIPVAPDLYATTFDVHGDLYGVAHSKSMGYRAGAVINMPIVAGKLAFRGAYGYLDDPGFIDYPYVVKAAGVSNPEPDFEDPGAVAANLTRVRDADWEQTSSGRLALLWEASDAVSATFSYWFQEQRVGGRTVNHRDSFGTGHYESAARFLEPNDRETGLLSAEIGIDLGFAELTSATGWSNYELLGQRDQTDFLLDLAGVGATYHTFPQFAAFTRETADEDRFNEELRLVSKGAGKLGWIAGLFYNDYELNDSSHEYTPGFTGFLGADLETGDLEYYQVRRQTLTERAVFGEVSYDFTDRLQVTFGGRWFDYDLAHSGTFGLPFFDSVDVSSINSSDDGFLGKINASYDFTRNLMGYVTISEGYRVGGANAVAPCPDPLPEDQQLACALPDEIRIDPDTTRNFEVGVKSAWNDGNLVFNGAVYQIDWDDIQTLDVTANGAVWITANGGSAESRGLELALTARGLEGWAFTTSYAYNDAELTSDAPGLVGGADAFAGDRLSGAPKHQGSFQVSHMRQLRNGLSFDATYGLTATSDVLTKVGSRDNGETLGGYTVHRMSVGLSEGSWSAVIYADNLTDKYAESAVRLDPSYVRDAGDFALRRYYRNVIRPRTVGVEVRYSFGQ